MNISTTIKAAALALALPVAAQAATINDGFNFSYNILTSPGTASVSYETAGKTWDIGTISFTANGSYSDISLVTITFSNTGKTYTAWTAGLGNTATLAAEGFTTSSDFTITYTYAEGGSGVVLTNATFDASEVLPAVPVPAAGILLVSALAGLGVAKRRRNKA
ncbi:VPLPA-CTERM sorting domain-containing protein [Paenirhodobacter populi]|nr:VPLPA-CTERM sorting domain-containing protein [Sinirhodobacter populi]